MKSYDPFEERRTFEAFLKTRGLRLTRQREIIFEEIYQLDAHLDADQIAARLKSAGKPASRATVYRTLDLLAEAGLAKRTRLGAKQWVYEPIRAGQSHDHMFCQETGKIIEFYSEEVDRLLSEICRKHNFQPSRHTIVIFGKLISGSK